MLILIEIGTEKVFFLVLKSHGNQVALFRGTIQKPRENFLAFFLTIPVEQSDTISIN
jgi:hypothetical protein